MPLVRISLRASKPPQYRRAIADGIYRAMREAFNVPEEDRFMTISEHAGEDFNYSANYLGIKRSDDLVIIQITANNTRSTAQKKAFYARGGRTIEGRSGSATGGCVHQSGGSRPGELVVRQRPCAIRRATATLVRTSGRVERVRTASFAGGSFGGLLGGRRYFFLVGGLFFLVDGLFRQPERSQFRSLFAHRAIVGEIFHHRLGAFARPLFFLETRFCTRLRTARVRLVRSGWQRKSPSYAARLRPGQTFSARPARECRYMGIDREKCKAGQRRRRANGRVKATASSHAPAGCADS
jgi:4-oxalocrotonate tautomerase